MSHSINNVDTGATTAYYQGVQAERERIIKNIQERVADLRVCHKPDTCHEVARLIESYIPEWTEGE